MKRREYCPNCKKEVETKIGVENKIWCKECNTKLSD